MWITPRYSTILLQRLLTSRAILLRAILLLHLLHPHPDRHRPLPLPLTRDRSPWAPGNSLLLLSLFPWLSPLQRFSSHLQLENQSIRAHYYVHACKHTVLGSARLFHPLTVDWAFSMSSMHALRVWSYILSCKCRYMVAFSHHFDIHFFQPLFSSEPCPSLLWYQPPSYPGSLRLPASVEKYQRQVGMTWKTWKA